MVRTHVAADRKGQILLRALAVLSLLAVAVKAGEGAGGDCPSDAPQRRGPGTTQATAAAAPRAAASAEQGSATQSRKRRFPTLTVGTAPADDRTLDTLVTWARSVDEAADKAQAEEKLVFVIHVSGDFEQPEFT